MITNTVFPFDLLADSYDDDFTASAIGRLQRERVWEILQPLLDQAGKKLKILEINCGTGTDATRLAALGHDVTATDASEKMLARAREKLAVNRPGHPPAFLFCPFNELAQRFKNQQFDLVFSNFGGLNCIDPAALKQLSVDLLSVIKPGAVLCFVVMGSCCINELFHFAARLQLSDATRRFRKSATFTVDGAAMPVFYYSPASIKKIFSHSFGMAKKTPVGLFIPPSYLEKKYKQRPVYLTRLHKLEKRFGLAAFSNLADHYCIVFKNQGAG